MTLRNALNHTSGLPDFTASRRFGRAATRAPTSSPAPRRLLSFVENRPLRFSPGSNYRYSNTDNVVVGLMVEAATGARYEQALRAKVVRPEGLRRTAMAKGILIPRPFIHGYAPDEESGELEDVSQVIAFGAWAWSSGGIVSTPARGTGDDRALIVGRV